MLYYAIVVLIGAVLSAAAGITELAADANKVAGLFFGLFALLLATSFALEWMASNSPAM